MPGRQPEWLILEEIQGFTLLVYSNSRGNGVFLSSTLQSLLLQLENLLSSLGEASWTQRNPKLTSHLPNPLASTASPDAAEVSAPRINCAALSLLPKRMYLNFLTRHCLLPEEGWLFTSNSYSTGRQPNCPCRR